MSDPTNGASEQIRMGVVEWVEFYGLPMLMGVILLGIIVYLLVRLLRWGVSAGFGAAPGHVYTGQRFESENEGDDGDMPEWMKIKGVDY